MCIKRYFCLFCFLKNFFFFLEDFFLFFLTLSDHVMHHFRYYNVAGPILLLDTKLVFKYVLIIYVLLNKNCLFIMWNIFLCLFCCLFCFWKSFFLLTLAYHVIHQDERYFCYFLHPLF